MNKNVYIIILIMICSHCHAKFALGKKIKSLWQKRLTEKIDQQEIPAHTIHSLSLANHHGSITIKTGPKKSLFLRAIKRAKKTELDNLEIVVENINNHVAISSKDDNKKKKGIIDYELIVPASCNIALNVRGSGDIQIKDVQGSLDIVTHDNVTIINTKKLSSVQTHHKGSITIINANGPVEAYTHKGTIIGENIADNFYARSTKGKINVSCKKLSSTGIIDLTTASGNITLALPAETNATLFSHTTYGTCMCDHEVTLKSYTTKLNKMAWTQFTRGVDGIIGTGTGNASIAINSSQGNVKIVDIS
jgi:hypothetical protein